MILGLRDFRPGRPGRPGPVADVTGEMGPFDVRNRVGVGQAMAREAAGHLTWRSRGEPSSGPAP